MLGFADLTNGETVQQPNQNSKSRNSSYNSGGGGSSSGSSSSPSHHPFEQLELQLDVFTNDH